MRRKKVKFYWLLGGLGLLLALGGIIYLSVNNNSFAQTQAANSLDAQQTSQSKIAVQNDYYDFGVIAMKNGLVKQTYQLVNQGQEPVIIKKAYTSCMCTKANIIGQNGVLAGPFGMPGHGGAIARANITIQPGEEFSVEAIFDPAAHGPSGVGMANRTIYLETNSAISPKIELKFSANVTN